MITKVRLKNWRSHLDSELNFSGGTNALVGILGSGKSSVLDGICFALFGTFPNLQSKKLKLDDLIMKKPIEKIRAETEVSIQLNGINYIIKRIIEKGKGTIYSEIKENGKLLEAPNTSKVTEIVENVLKINYDLFSKAIYSEQNALDYFLTIQKGQRMRKIDELLMIDKFERARANAVTLINKIAERKFAKQSIVEQIDIVELQKIILELKNSVDKIWNEKLSMEKELSSILIEKEKLEKEFLELQKIKENLEILKREEKGINSVLDEIYSTLENLEKNLKGVDKNLIEKNLKDFIRYIAELEDILKERQKRYEKLQEQTSKSKAEIEFLKREKIDELEKELEEKLRVEKELEHYKKLIGKDIEKELDKKKIALEKYVGEIEALKIKIKDLQEIIDQLSSLEGKCPVCGSKLTEEKKIILIKQKAFQIESLKERFVKALEKKEISENELKKLEEAAGKLDEMLSEIKDLDKIKTELENSKNIFLVLNESSVKLENELTNLRSELENLQRLLKDAQEKKQKFEIFSMQFHEYEEKRERVNELIKQRTELASHITEHEKILKGKELDKMDNWLRNLIAKENEISTKISSLEQIVKEKEVRMKDFEQTFNIAMKEKEEIVKLEKLIQELKIFEKALEQTQLELRKEFVTSVNYTMNKIWQNLYPYQDFVGIKLEIEEGDYILQLQSKDGSWVNVEGFASGGERSISCLALRIAFALVLAPQLRWLVLDEPTANLDRKAIEVLATVMRERISGFVDQMFIITHQEELEEAVTGNAYRLERDKSKDGVTKVISVV